ncbi:hypothetical protein OMP38_10050 [Cohnella ginsengisoli]|uniref:Uncharacterized protein n=1 Tax=Cohnella ginsengisoli TaxID=425004 RepID=A0A9X4KJU3_9BACL|nr:hypothetical protein [Cohnella ginsengisoli]MDG0791175.1 hypothetical protein [Cohnella ginsengisoli]
MYDYVSIHSQSYKEKIQAKVLDYFLTFKMGFNKSSHLRYFTKVDGQLISITGISANQDGNYSYSTLDEASEVNLVEINVPSNSNSVLEEAISEIAIAIVQQFSWLIDEEHGLS